ncbi:protein TIC 40, chloroplastic [Andrographis paniculata]|uniref:protein TIC 40, chloroplastic n=1 Tax=Andrographis paniculata TaxID=175694 RepID=UPI0021E6ED20|nr:protein TIC 40, chloroplastic [Andrographis paniculata]
MENLGLVSSPKVVIGLSSKPTSLVCGTLPNLLRKNRPRLNPTPSFRVFSSLHAPNATKTIVSEKVARDCFASIASGSQQTSSVGVNPQASVPPSSSQVGTPLFWIGVGVGLSALFSWVAGRAKKYAMEQAFKTLSQQMNAQNSPFGNAAYSPGSSFAFPPTATPPSDSSRTPTPVASQPVTVDVPVTNVKEPPSPAVEDKVEPEKESRKYAFVDVSPEETLQKNDFENFKDSINSESMNGSQSPEQSNQEKFFQSSSNTKQETGASDGPFANKTSPLLSVEALEKMMEDPTVQKMVYPYLPEEMRNPTTFKWMLQNPQYRQQLQDMLNNMGGSPEWDSRMMESLKNFDLSSPEIKQQFDQIGLTPEEVISKIMANPEVAMAFQNPRVQAAIMDCSQNPMSIAKYQNDKEVMDVFNKISELFPGARGP